MTRPQVKLRSPSAGGAQAVIFLLPLLLAACAAGPDYRPITPEQALPGHFATRAGDGSVPTAGDWWRQFGDPGLDALVAAALRNSPDLAAAEANIRQARASLAQVASARSPQLDAQAREGRDRISRNGEQFADIPFPNAQNTFTDERAGVDASWEIDLFGHTARAVEAAGAQAEGAEAQRGDLALRVSAETARNVLDYRYLRLRIAKAQASVADNGELLRLVQLQRGAGLASDSDLHQAQINLRNAQAVLPPLQAAAGACLAALLPLTALTEDQIAAHLGTGNGLPALPSAQAFGASSTLLQRRPDLRAAERSLAAATAQVGMAQADRYPRFTLVGDAGWETVHPGSLWRKASQYWNLGPEVYLPLLNGGRISAEIRQSEAARDAALASYRKAVLAALADVESAMLRCQGDDGRLAETSAALASQQQNVELTQLRVDAGESSALELLAGRLQRTTLEDQQLASRQALSEDLVLLYKALGGSVPQAKLQNESSGSN
jgi:NodT family efflux transporter outer membrane factor (OMF) lipoprotein